MKTTAHTLEAKVAFEALEQAFRHPAMLRKSYDATHHINNNLRDYGLYLDGVVDAWATVCAKASPEDHPVLLSKTIKEIESHLFTRSHVQEAFNLIERRLPMSFALFNAFIQKTSASQDKGCVNYLIEHTEIEQDQFRAMLRALAFKKSYDAVSVLFGAWILKSPPTALADKEEVGDIAWGVIICSLIFTQNKPDPRLINFIRLFEKNLKESLPLLSKNGKPLLLLPDIKVIESIMEAGFDDLSTVIVESVLHHDEIYDRKKFIILEQQGFKISEQFIQERLTINSSENGWKMALSYYLSNDSLELDARSIHRPSLLSYAGSEPTNFTIRTKDLIKTLSVGSTSAIADKKRMSLVALYVDGRPDIIKELLKAGLPEKYLEIGSVREEKLMLDLGI
jgi:hypothetical protein